MRIPILIGLCCLFTLIGFSQSAPPFKPNWKVGEKKELEITSIVQQGAIDLDKLTSSNAVKSIATISVFKEDVDSYYLEINCENNIYNYLMELMEQTGIKINGVRRLLLQVKVNKLSGEMTLTNTQDLFLITHKTAADAINSLPNDSGMRVFFRPILNYYGSEDAVRDILNNDFTFLKLPYTKGLSLTYSTKHTEMINDGFNKDKKLKSTVNISPVKQSTNKELFVMNCTSVIDSADWVESLKRSYRTAMGGIELTADLMNTSMFKEMMEMKGSDVSELVYNANISWPVSYTNTFIQGINYEGEWLGNSITRTIIIK